MSTLHFQSHGIADELSVRRFEVRESLSTPFVVDAWVRTTNPDVDLDAAVGNQASLFLEAAEGRSRRWSGICLQAELVEAEPTGLSTYYFRFTARLALLDGRRNHRVFQHASIPDTVKQLLGEWEIDPRLEIDAAAHAPRELRVQYGESDLQLVHRLLEEAGISYYFGDSTGDDNPLVLTDAPEHAPPRDAPLTFIDNASAGMAGDYVTNLTVTRQLQPGKTTLRDFDFWRATKFPLLASSDTQGTIEDRMEDFRYQPGAFLVELAGAAAQAAGAAGEAPAQVEAALGAAAQELEGAVAAPFGAAREALEGAAAAFEAGGVAAKLGAAQAARSAVLSLLEQSGDIGGELKQIANRAVSNALAGPALGETVARAMAATGARPGPRLAADDLGVARHTVDAGAQLAANVDASRHALRRQVSFRTNAFDVAPGARVRVEAHPSARISGGDGLLVTRVFLHGQHDSEWHANTTAAFASAPYRPTQRTAKPRVMGMQSAVVVGPPGEEIHTDEFGRVRVQFHWDREGGFDERSCCWVRVARAWAGAGYGLVTIPRVGQEVLLGFLEGDPDLPVVVGQLFNRTCPTPYKLPEHKTRSTWRSQSSPGGDGHNEITLDDAAGKELLYLRAQRDMQEVVQHDRASLVGGVDKTLVGEEHRVVIWPQDETRREEETTHFKMIDKKIILTTGEATIELDGPNIRLSAKGKISIQSTGDDLVLDGGPFVKVNCTPVGREGEEGEAAPGEEHDHAAAHAHRQGKGGTGTKLTPAQEKAAFEAAHAEAMQRLKNTEASLKRWNADDQAAFKKWFGPSLEGAELEKARKQMRYETKRAIDTLDKIDYDNLEPFDPGDDVDAHDAYAYVHANDKDLEIHVSDLFWAQPNTGVDSKATTLIHEVSHFRAAGSQKDVLMPGQEATRTHAYGIANSLSLAQQSSAGALQNAENYSFYVMQR